MDDVHKQEKKHSVASPLLKVKDQMKEILEAKGLGKDIENSIRQEFN